MSKYLKSDHPSFGCDQAWFLFAVKNHAGPGFCRLVLVEATSHPAVAFLERVASGDGRVSATTSLMTVHRQCPSIGMRSEMVEEVPFSAFANDMVDRALVDRDPLAVQAYREAVARRPPPPAIGGRGSPASGRAHDDVVSALSGLGFKRAQAEAMVAALGPIGDQEPAELIRAALRASKSAAG